MKPTKRQGSGTHKLPDTSWGKVADWYSEHVAGSRTYHETVIAPNLLRMLGTITAEEVLDIGCGEGYFSRLLSKQGARVTGIDIAPELIEKAQKDADGVSYHVCSADDLSMFENDTFNFAICILALQNIKEYEKAISEAARVLKDNGRFFLILNHPAFRVPKRSSWGFDEKNYVQYRRLDGYLSKTGSKIDMTPGSKGSEKEYTWSFHRPLSAYVKALRDTGFAVTDVEEWISDRVSEPGPRAKAENKARNEFPLFLAIEARVEKEI